MVDSGSLVHNEHLSSWITLLLVRFIAVGRISWQARHAKILILLGICSFQTVVHTFFATHPPDVPT